MAIAMLEESELRQLIREELLAVFQQQIATVESHDTLPPTFTVKEAAQFMRIGVNKCYDLTRRKGFPAIRDGWKITIPRDALLKWMETESFANSGAACDPKKSLA